MDDQIIIGIIATFAIFIIVFVLAAVFRPARIELPEKRAGRLGERFARTLIREILVQEDILLANVHLAADDKETELDNVVINSHGVFIIEVKNYNGELFGDEDDREWIKNNTTPAGSVCQAKIKNPIKQVRRQIYILSRYLKERGIDVRIDGCVFFAQGNSPVNSDLVVNTQADIEEKIHMDSKVKLSPEVQEQITGALTEGEKDETL
ncbi:MAG: NERD domain-containing protein [Lachnospiraceae bacterium]|nr:NERD domain-containing protein [Lachnospiraceae bacterium]